MDKEKKSHKFTLSELEEIQKELDEKEKNKRTNESNSNPKHELVLKR